ncbi:MAG TPA: UDP-2,3-diacylglucosamine diphosphatase [Thermodesulfobacteriota bacterium]|nr:UDP-2,3-diacylglucosamine diphosphatase [Thermodesulfobacteriota bacterium]
MVSGRSEKDWIFVSDAHFTGRDPESMEAFLGFLDSEKNQIGRLVILGDFFEFFFGFKKFFITEQSSAFTDYLPVFNKLQSLCREGIQIKYFEGNHDFFLRSFFSEQFGMEVEVYPDGCEERLGGKRVFIAHGDLSNPKQWAYRTFRRILKNPVTYRLIQVAGPRISRWVARKLSDMSYEKYHNDVQPASPPAFKVFAHQKFLEGFEIVILGHSHFPEEVEEWIDGRRCLYYNAGDWMVHRSFLRFTPPDRFQLERYHGG